MRARFRRGGHRGCRRRIRRVLRNRRQAPSQCAEKGENGAAGRFGSRSNKSSNAEKTTVFVCIAPIFRFLRGIIDKSLTKTDCYVIVVLGEVCSAAPLCYS